MDAAPPATTPEPPPPPRVEVGWRRPSRGLGATLRGAVLRVLDVADKVAEAIAGKR
jgi:hypothetical protein